MSDSLEWASHQIAADGVVEQSFRLVRQAGTVPGVLWLPAFPASSPAVVLLGHGGSGHKRSERIVSMALWFASRARIAAIAIDGPYHGDRLSSPMTAREYQERIAAEGIELVLDRMAADWLATLDALHAAGVVDTSTAGYLGMSMGTRFGLPLAAAMGTRLRCAVLGKFGLRHAPSALHEGLAAPERIASDARHVAAPVLFHIQWHDEVFPRDGQLALFDLLGSPGKELIAHTGTHAETKPAAVTAWREFISRHLAPRTLRGAGSAVAAEPRLI